jgi:hypothetical protein
MVDVFKHNIRAIISDPIIIDGALGITNPIDCRLEGFATAQGYCGTAPYTYTWQVSTDGITWVNETGVNNTLSFKHYAPLNGARTSILYIKVIIKDANNLERILFRLSRANCKSPGNWMFNELPKRSNDNTLDFKVKAYPNPANNFIKIENLPNSQCELQIFDITGHLIKTGIIKSDIESIDNLKSGFYIIKIIDNNDKSIIYSDYLLKN